MAAILAAGGRGLRFGGGSTPKQFVELNGLPIYMWSLSTLLSNDRINSAVVVVPPDMVALMTEQLAEHESRLHGKKASVIVGGDTRQKSVYLGIQSLSHAEIDYALIHDAARPFLTGPIVDRVISAVIEYGACTTAIPPADTIKKIDAEFVAETLNRDSLVMVQTPQAGRFSWLLSAHAQAQADNYATTDDAAILEHAGHRVAIVHGAPFNLKITRPDDLILAKALATFILKDRL